MERTILVFKTNEEKSIKHRFGHYPEWATFNKPRLNRVQFLKENGIETSSLFHFTPEYRGKKADELIKNVFSHKCEAALAIITALEPIRNKTQQSLFELNSFDNKGEQTLQGGYNQTLKINIELHPVKLTPEMVEWEPEHPVQFIDQILENKLVVNHSVTPFGNSCYSLAVGCILENNILKVGKNAEFYFRGANGNSIKFDYYFRYNGNLGENVTVPADMDIFRFKFNFHNWKEYIKKGEYIKKDAVSVAKTDNGNYVLIQFNPRRAILILKSGEIVENNRAEFGSAKHVITDQCSLLNYKEAISFYENILQKEKDEKDREFQEQMDELYKKEKGWYIVELHCFENDYRRGGHRERWTNWKILADSKIQAYNSAFKSAEEKGFFWIEENPTKCQIEFYGFWDDLKEDILREQGLI